MQPKRKWRDAMSIDEHAKKRRKKTSMSKRLKQRSAVAVVPDSNQISWDIKRVERALGVEIKKYWRSSNSRRVYSGDWFYGGVKKSTRRGADEKDNRAAYTMGKGLCFENVIARLHTMASRDGQSIFSTVWADPDDRVSVGGWGVYRGMVFSLTCNWHFILECYPLSKDDDLKTNVCILKQRLWEEIHAALPTAFETDIIDSLSGGGCEDVYRWPLVPASEYKTHWVWSTGDYHTKNPPPGVANSGTDGVCDRSADTSVTSTVHPLHQAVGAFFTGFHLIKSLAVCLHTDFDGLRRFGSKL